MVEQATGSIAAYVAALLAGLGITGSGGWLFRLRGQVVEHDVRLDGQDARIDGIEKRHDKDVDEGKAVHDKFSDSITKMSEGHDRTMQTMYGRLNKSDALVSNLTAEVAASSATMSALNKSVDRLLDKQDG